MPNIEGFRSLVFDRTLPLWRDNGWDVRFGGFYDRLNGTLPADPTADKRLLVQCRQLYVFSQAECLQPDQGWRKIADRCFQFLLERYRDPKYGGWYFSIKAEGDPADRRKDGYAHAFVLFALAHYFAATKLPTALRLAEETLDLMEQHLTARSGGFYEAASQDWTVLPDLRRQNPHMHLLESFLALFDVTRLERYRRHAEQIVDLFETRFFDRATCTLGEFFDEDLRPDPVRGAEIEPGHHFEWYWLLRRYEKTVGPMSEPHLMESLFDWAARYGIDREKGGVFDQLDRTGQVIKSTKRLWPIAEAIKAYSLRSGTTDRGQLDELVRHLLDRHQDSEQMLIERLDREGHPVVTELYGSSPYHLLFAYSQAACRD